MSLASRAARRAVWFRTDLRLDDNPALCRASEGAQELVGVYVFNPALHNVPTLAGSRKSSARRARFLIQCVADLRKRMEAIGGSLACAVGDPSELIPKLCVGCSVVYTQQGVCSEETRDEARVERALKRAGSSLNREWGGTLYFPKDCGSNLNRIPLQFTAFKNKAESHGVIRAPLAPPKKLPTAPADIEKAALSFLPTLEQLGYPADESREAEMDDPRGVLAFEGGEGAALQRLKKWMWEDDQLKQYFEIRNGMLGEGYSSKFSPWLALGCLSPRRIHAEQQRYERERVKNKSTYWLQFELTWRDFFVYMALSQGDRIFTPGGVTGSAQKWRGGPAELQKWKEGKTGKRLVDANMRELLATGFMSNRGRQNVASYLILDLGVDWRYGAAHFEEYLLDYDPGSNWGNWVAAAGLTGGRINRFNIEKQTRDYDPQGKYCRHWLDGKAPRLVASNFKNGDAAANGGSNGRVAPSHAERAAKERRMDPTDEVVERRADPNERGTARQRNRYSHAEFIELYGKEQGRQFWDQAAQGNQRTFERPGKSKVRLQQQ